MEDEKSKYIFKERHLYNIDKNFTHIENIVKNSVSGFCGPIYYPGKELELVEKIKTQSEKPLYIWGGGYKGAKLFQLLKEHSIIPTGWLDTNYERLAEIDGLTVYEPSAERVKDAIIIVSITKNKVAQSVADLCREYGASQVFLYNDYSIHSIDGQYFDFNIIKLGNKETFIDAGAFDLATSKEFRKYCGQSKVECSVYAFEPDKISYEKCLRKIASIT